MYRGALINVEKKSSKASNKIVYRGSKAATEDKVPTVRNVTVIVQQDCTLLKFTQSELDKALVKYPKLHQKLTDDQQVQQCLTNISLSSLFICLPADVRFMIARRSKVITHKSGATLNQAGKYLSHVQLIISGYVHLYESSTQGEPNYCGRLGLGDVLGLEKSLENEPPRILYKADTQCQTIQIDLMVIADIIALSQKFRSLMVKYIAQSSTKTSRMMRLWDDEIE